MIQISIKEINLIFIFLIIACNKNNENIVKYLIDHKTIVNKEDQDSKTTLIKTCYI